MYARRGRDGMVGHRPADWHPLELDKDPTPGDPDRVRSLAKQLHDFAHDVSEAVRLVKGMAGEDTLLEWAGKSAEVFKEQFGDVPKNLKKLKTSYEMCGDALADFWPKLERAQALADRALAKAKEAQDDLTSAKSRLSSADSWVTRANKEADKYKDDPTGRKSDGDKPDEAKVRAATRDVQSAKSAHSKAQSDVTTAQSALDAAKKMAEDARKMREEAAGETKRKIDEASDAGIQNRSWWEDIGDWFEDNWDTIVAVCKVVVAVVGIVAMIIGGPILGAIVLIAALVVLADTLYKYSQGQASLWDVAFAALDCIPGGKGITSFGKLAKGLRGLGKTGLKGMALGAKGFGKSTRVLGRQMKKLITRGDPVDLATGELVMSAVDVSLDGVLPLVLERHHRTRVRSGRLLGPSWVCMLDQRLALDATGVRLAVDDGMVLTYPVPDAAVSVLPVEGPAWPLSWDGSAEGEFVVHRPETGHRLIFRPLPGRPSPELPLAAVVDRNGNTIDVTYRADGTPEEIVHHGGYRIGVTCENGRITELALRTHPEQPLLVRYGYDDRGDLTAVHNSFGPPLRFSYDDSRRITRWDDRNGVWYRFDYDEAGRCVAGHGMDGFLSYTFTYDDEAHSTVAVNSLGHPTHYRFNDAFQLVEETDAFGHAVTQEWDHRDRLLSRTDQLGRSLRMEWDEAGRPTAVRLPDGSVSTTRYNDLGLPVVITEYDGAVLRQEWDERGNCTSLTTGDGATTRFGREPTGALATLTDATGAVHRFTNNPAGQSTSATDPLGAVSTYTYDAFGRCTTVVDALGGATRRTYSAEGHLTSLTSPDGGVERWTYDGEGNQLTHTDVLGRTTAFTYGPFDLLTSRTTPDGVRHTFTHDTELRLLRVTGPRELTWDYRYDAVGNLISETDFDGGTLAYTHDPARQLLSRTNAVGQSAEFSYDEVGNQIRSTLDGRTTTYQHDRAGRLVRAVGPDATLTYAYDAGGRVTAETVDGRTLTTAYDVLGRPVHRTMPSGAVSTYAYDAAGHRASLTAADRTLEFAHDSLGRETTRRIGTGLTLTLAWDAGDRLTAQQLTAPTGPRPLTDRTYTYRPDGHVTAFDDRTAGRRTFDLDPDGHVLAVRAEQWTESYAYDEQGNQTRASWPDGYPAQEGRGERVHQGNRVLRAGGIHYEYDAAGRVVLRCRTRLSRKPDIWRYTWDADDRLTSAVTPDGTVWRYLYDPLGRRVAKQRLTTDGQGIAEETRFTWDGPHLVEQSTVRADSSRTSTLTWDRDGVRPLTQTERTTLADAPQEVVDERFYAIVTDLVGTPTELVSEGGDVVWRADATLWGLTGPQGSVGTSTPLRFPGQYFDPETQLHYNFFRYYDPVTAAYISADPLGLDAGPNPRAYVPNPLSWLDYLGLLTCAENADLLAKNLAREGRAKSAGEAAAHIVPSGMKRNGAAQSRALLEKYGVDINDAANGIPLGHPRPHNFTHRKMFLTRLNAHLNITVDRMTDAGYGARAIRGALRRELRSIGQQVEAELAGGQPAVNAIWTAP
ncbi:RHS repeat-associated core domain-containing protein [Streptomyces sp. NPDC001982]|uniref:RHS repeat-associated core domain-containing protein n=1 Tax=Streptomyces sp. NPDC001982 TaxID=3154405 RepID=UPI00333316F8